MTSLDLSSRIDPKTVKRRQLKAILLPVEHGGWGLTLEPVIAGLIVSFSVPGLALAGLIVTAFLARQPLRIVTRPGGNAERVRTALIALSIEAAFMAVLLGVVLAHDVSSALWVLMLASPLALFLLWRDHERRSRDLIAELAAALFMSAAATAIVLAGGESRIVAAVLGALVAARSVGAILHVRERVNARKGKPSSRVVPIAFHVVALVLSVAVALTGLANFLVVVAFAILLGRALMSTTPESAAKLGWAEVRAGLTSLLLISLSLVL